MASAHESLTFKPLHAPGGHCNVAFISTEGGTHLLTAGADGRTVLRALDTLEEKAAYVEDKPIECLVVAKGAKTVAIAVDIDVKLLELPSLAFRSTVLSEELPVRALAFSPDGTKLATGGDFADVRVFSNLHDTVRTDTIKHPERYVRSLEWDPQGTYLAASEARGHFSVYGEEGTGVSAGRKYRTSAATAPGIVGQARNAVAWHPDGSQLAIPGQSNDVVLVDRMTWSVKDSSAVFLAGEHTTPVTITAFSPNGLYVASASQCGEVCIWDIHSSSNVKVVARARPSSAGAAATAPDRAAAGPYPDAPCSLAWHPEDNVLVVGDDAGRVCVWRGPVPARLVSPAARGEAAAAARVRGAAQAASGAAFGSVLSGGLGYSRGGGQEVEAGGVRGSGGEGDEGDVLPDEGGDAEDEGAEEEGDGGSRERAGRERGRAIATVGRPRVIERIIERAPPGPTPQPPFQPGSTPALPPSSSRFLAYNMLGYVSTTPGVDDDCAALEISFHDTLKASTRLPVLSDPWGITLAALGSSGALHASPTTLLYRPFDDWVVHGQWTMHLPEGEEALCVAAGSGFCAAATSRQLLRVFSPHGVQAALLTLAGAPVALAAQPEGALLAIVTHAGPPDVATKSQNLSLDVYHMDSQALVERCAIALTPGSTLTWLAFTAEGLPCTGDSTGVLRVRSPDFGGTWVPVFDSVAQAKGGEVFWPVELSSSLSMLTSVVCPRHAPHPVLHPRPIFSRQPLSLPLLGPDGPSRELESELLLRGISAAVRQQQQQQGVGGDAVAAAAAEADVKARDACLIKLVLAALEGDAPGRALELAFRMTTEQAVEGAMKLANFRRMPRVASSIGDLLQARRDEAAAHAAQAAAAEEAAAGQQQQQQQREFEEMVVDEEAEDGGGAEASAARDGGSRRASAPEPLVDSSGRTTSAPRAAAMPAVPTAAASSGGGAAAAASAGMRAFPIFRPQAAQQAKGSGAPRAQQGVGSGAGAAATAAAAAAKRKLPASGNPFARCKKPDHSG